MVVQQIGRQILNVLKLGICIFGLITTFYMVIDLTYFLSVPKMVKYEASSRGTLFKILIQKTITTYIIYLQTVG